ncbi:hypothetical protein GCM10023322_82460 [Rugosimonospora acidiphila]|uniref:Acyl transferase domain-containing protein n=1 Tax=Rugosimonospora acidiphila TaxID=556531 RepID=A0ABP9SVB4_9ACTN
MDELEAAAGEPIAVIGMGCRFPGGADTPQGLWDLVATGTDAIAGFPADRGWRTDGLFGDAEDSGTTYVREGGFLYDVAGFDPGFFGISPREALAMDPQQRLLLEVAWESFEQAGIVPRTLRGSRAGVFVGAAYQGYGTGAGEALRSVEGHLMTGNATSVVSGRLAYTFGLEGPAITVDTACSSSLVALHLAVQSLRRGECTLALAGGAGIMVNPDMFVEFSRQRGLAADGRCKSFADEADGTGWGEGAGIVLVERLSDAQRLGHPILAVIRGSAVNQDGASSGLSAPNGPSQQRVIRAALADARLAASEVDAVEAHGTGTALGDPIEAQALLATYGREHTPDRPLWLGSFKSNVGHTQAAAGIGGVIKMVQALRYATLPPTLHAEHPSGQVDWGDGTVRLLTDGRPWPTTGSPRRGAVSSFGISGTNAHIVLEEAPEPEPTAEPAAPEALPILLSGNGPAALRDQATRLLAHLDGDPATDQTGVSATLALSRTQFPDRAAVVGDNPSSVRAALAALASGEDAPGLVTGTALPGGKVAFVFPGQGAQWPGMATALLDTAPVFAQRMTECDAALAPFVDWSLLDVLRGAPDAPPLDRVDVVQPALFAMMVSLAELWRAHGVRPDAVVGHSQGEIAAAVVAGALSLSDGARVVGLRSQALRALSGAGGMVSVSAAAQRVTEWAAQTGAPVEIAAVNGPATVVVSGPPAALDDLLAWCAEQDIRARRVPVDYASHSSQIEGLRDELLATLAPVRPRPAEIPMLSTVTAQWVDGTGLDADYWYRNLRGTVRLDPAVRALAGAGYRHFLEMSPHPVLTVSIGDVLDDAGVTAATGGSLRRDDGGLGRFRLSVASAHVRGLPVDWASVFPAAPVAALPTYAFQRRRYWLEPDAVAEQQDAAPAADDDFWQAVDSADLELLTEVLGVEEDASLADLLPALSDWRRRQQDESIVDSWRYRIEWQPRSTSADGRPGGRWLAVLPAATPSHPVLDALRDAALSVEVLRVGADPDRAGLANQLAGHGADIDGVVSLLAVDDRPDPARPGLTSGLVATLLLAQALGDAAVSAPLWLLTTGAVVAGAKDAPPDPAQAQIWGLGRVVGLEHPDRWGGLIDLPAALDGRTGAQLAALLTGGGDEDQIALRPAGALVRRLVRARPPRSGRPLNLRGTALVTGGTGALGAHIANWLAGCGVEHVVMLSRRGADAPGAAALAELEVPVTVRACDVADREALRALVAELTDAGHEIRTVIHAAALIELDSVVGTDPDRLAAVAHAKVAGAENLDAIFTGDLDAFVLFSSIAGVWGSGEHASYATANAHLDALAERRRARGLRATTIAWGVWAAVNAWAEARTGQDVDAQRLIRQGLPFLDPGRALHALGRALADDETFLAIADIDWPRFAPVFAAARPRPLLDGIPQARQALAAAPSATPDGGADTPIRARLAGLSAAARLDVLVDLVRSRAAAVLGHASADDVPPDRAMRELGFDSLTAVDLRGRLNAATGLSLPSTVVFDHPTAEDLARRLDAELTGAALTDTVTAGPVAADEQIAIVAMSCRYPGGVASPEDLWQLLADGRDAISVFPTDRGWDNASLFDPDPDNEGTSYTRQGGFLYNAGDFDAAFFGISPREAVTMDPQQRLLLETTWEALERAGIDPRTRRGTPTGVFVGTNYQDYGIGLAAPDTSAGHLLTGGAASVVSGRISYTLGLEGPAVTVDTACSSSLVALHLAAQALRQGECDLALAAGVAVMSTPGSFVAFSRQRALAPDGRCKAFAEAADGMGLAEGISVLLVERLADARRNGHPVLALIRGSAVNQDGASNGLTAPNGRSQQKVIRQALAHAGLGANEVDVVEAHGTGTTLGDPIEAQALLATYGRDRDPDRPLWIGSVKSNIGHTQAASGIAGVIKMVLAMRHEVLPRTLHIDQPSTHVDWSAGTVRLLSDERAWPAGQAPRRAGVSSFGMSGTNVHVLLEEPPVADPAPRPTTGSWSTGAPLPWVLSARTDTALRAQAGRLAAAIGGAPDQGGYLAEVGYSLLCTRSTFERRAVLVARDEGGFRALLNGLADGEMPPGVVTGAANRRRKTAFVFPGQGSQWTGMALELLDVSTVFSQSMTACAEALLPHLETPLSEPERLWPWLLADAEALNRVDLVQPALFAVMVSLAEVWRAHGVVPDAVIGHSQGEIAAAVVAGALSLDDGARLIALRSRALVALSGVGAMASVGASADTVAARLAGYDGRLVVAAVNGPETVVVSGDVDAMDSFEAETTADGIRFRRIPVDYASHSPHVERLRDELAELFGTVRPSPAGVTFCSTVTGGPVDPTVLDAGYWYDNLRKPVLLEPAVRALADDGYDTFVECSPHPVLTLALSGTLDAAGHDGLVLSSLRRDEDSAERMLRSLAEAHTGGVEVDWTLVTGTGHRTVELPTYAFDGTRFWLDPQPARQATLDVDEAFWAAVRDGDLAGLADWRDRHAAAQAAQWCYRIAWNGPLPAAPATLAGRWIALVPDAGRPDAAAILDALAARGAEVVPLGVPAGGRPALAAELGQLAAAGPVSGVALLAASGPADGVLATAAELAPALADAGLTAPAWLITRHAVAITEDETPDPDQAALWGLGRVVGLEYPALWGGLVDLPEAWDEAAADLLAGVLAGDGVEDQVAIRPGGVHARRLVPAGFTDKSGPGGAWKPQGTVLITGGTGALGAHVARWLARSGAEHLVLTSRRGEDAPGARELRDELATTGVGVTIAACDLADRGAVVALLDDLRANDHLPSAVVHAAGIPQASTLDETTGTPDDTADTFAQMYSGKVTGARHLDELLGDGLDAFVLFSSNSGVWGSAGQGAYAAANAWLDGFAARRRAQGRAATSVAWGLWAGGGMAGDEGEHQLRRRGLRPMDPENAVAALRQALDRGVDFVAVADVDWDRFLPVFTAARPRPLFDDLPRRAQAPTAGESAADPAGDGAPAELARLRALPEAERQDAVLTLVRATAAAALGHAGPQAVDSSRPFRELGFDSVTAVEVRNRLRAATGLALPATALFDYPTAAALARHLLDQIAPSGDEIFDQLDRIEEALPSAGTDENTRMRLRMRLRTLLERCEADDAAAGDDAETQLAEASADEVFAFIENQFGIS